MNVLNGGDYLGNAMALKDFMMAPVGARSVNEEAVRLNSKTYACLKSLIITKHGIPSIGINDDGDFAPSGAIDFILLVQVPTTSFSRNSSAVASYCLRPLVWSSLVSEFGSCSCCDKFCYQLKFACKAVTY